MREQPLLKVTMVPTEKLVPYKGNAKLHPESQIRQIEGSIREFDFSDPIGAWHDADGNAVIVEGHGRLLAAKRMGIGELPVIFLDYLSDEQRRAYTLVHNQIAMSTGFDAEDLARELEGITSIDMGQFGLSDDDAEEIDIDELFDMEETGAEPRRVTCPECGTEFEI